ncbi:hypothetical protein SRHO_G00047730 [Serrasalmus rhombeus]
MRTSQSIVSPAEFLQPWSGKLRPQDEVLGLHLDRSTESLSGDEELCGCSKNLGPETAYVAAVGRNVAASHCLEGRSVVLEWKRCALECASVGQAALALAASASARACAAAILICEAREPLVRDVAFLKEWVLGCRHYPYHELAVGPPGHSCVSSVCSASLVLVLQENKQQLWSPCKIEPDSEEDDDWPAP